MNKKILVAIGDVGHTDKMLSNNFVPINIGFMGAYLEKIFPNEIDVVLFKDSKKLLRFVGTNKPDVLAMSNYCWNVKLTHHLFRYYKNICPSGVTIIGGPNFPIDKDEVALWMNEHTHIDFAIERESELPGAHILTRLFETDFDLAMATSSPVSGSFCLSREGELQHIFEPALKELDDIPSPYLNGSMDEFLIHDVKGFALIPLLETTRGCPFTCTFCTSGDKWYQKVREFSDERVLAEIDYIAKILNKHNRKISGVMITDLNFGSFPRDAQISEKLYSTYRELGWPQSVMATTGKTRGERVLETVAKHPGLAMTMAVQSMDDEVLDVINRKNFPTDKFLMYQKQLKLEKRLSKSDTILALPEDTREKHFETLNTLINLGIDVIDTFSYMMLKGTYDELPHIRQKYGFKTKWRLLPGNFSIFKGESIFETEEVVVETNTFSYEDYKYCRKIHLLLTTICNWTIFLELKKLMIERDLDVIVFLQRIEAYLTSLNGQGAIADIMGKFSRKVEDELFSTEQELYNFYTEKNNYQRLLKGNVGENLLQNYRFKMISNIRELMEIVINIYGDFIEEHGFDRKDRVEENLFSLLRVRAECIDNLLGGKYTTELSPIEFELDFNFIQWVGSDSEESIDNYSFEQSIGYKAYYNDEHLTEFDIFLPKERNMEDDEKARAMYRMGTTKMMPIFEKTVDSLSRVAVY